MYHIGPTAEIVMEEVHFTHPRNWHASQRFGMSNLIGNIVLLNLSNAARHYIVSGSSARFGSSIEPFSLKCRKGEIGTNDTLGYLIRGSKLHRPSAVLFMHVFEYIHGGLETVDVKE